MDTVLFLFLVFLAIVAFPLGVLISDIQTWFNNKKIRREWIKQSKKV